MPARTVKGPVFTLIFQGQQIVVKHVSGKGNRCRVIAPEGVQIELGVVVPQECNLNDSTIGGIHPSMQATPAFSASKPFESQ